MIDRTTTGSKSKSKIDDPKSEVAHAEGAGGVSSKIQPHSVLLIYTWPDEHKKKEKEIGSWYSIWTDQHRADTVITV